MDDEHVIIEFRRIGASIKVSAIDPKTLTEEVSLAGPAIETSVSVSGSIALTLTEAPMRWNSMMTSSSPIPTAREPVREDA